ncbi:hypothetical protein J4204_02685 [Candidatus Woesearchaeota archaeon]|nr:hypothetical protein [Candidatus Woesearchaeota archaeon]
MKNKRAITTFEILMWVPRILFLVVVMFTVMILIRSYVATTIDTSELEANIFISRILYSPNSISYFDSDIGRTYQGVIDINKFKSQTADKFLERSVYYGDNNKEIGAKFLLRDLSSNENNEVTIYYNEDFFREQKKLADSGFTRGPGGARGYSKKYDVIISKDNILNRGVLAIDVVVPNS